MNRAPTVDSDTRRGLCVSGLAGWEEFVFEQVEVALIGGRPALTGFRIRRLDSAAPVALTTDRLSRIPAQKIANAAAQFTPLSNGRENAAFAALRLFREFEESDSPTAPPRPRGGSAEFHQWVLDTIAYAHGRGEPSIPAIAAGARVGTDRAKQFSAAAQRWRREQDQGKD